jgi:hypothetical protein
VKPEPAGLLEHLNRRDVVVEPNHLAQQTQLADLHELVESRIA